MSESLNTCNCNGCELKALFFGKVGDTELSSICNIKKEKQYLKGEVIIEEGTFISDFHYLKTGLVKLYRNADGHKSQIIKFAGPLDFVSLLSVFSDKNYHYTVAAIEDSIICSIKLETIKNIALENGKFALGLLERMSETSDDIIKTFLEIRKRNLRGRIAYVLMYFADSIYKKQIFELPVSRKEIAELIEMTTENVIRILSEFRKDGIIKINGKTIEIIDKNLLNRINELG